MHEILQELSASLAAGRPFVYTRLVSTRGSTPQKAGAAMLVFPDGAQAGTLGGGCVEAEVKRRALANLAHSRAEIVDFQLDGDYGWDDGLICGGRMQVLVQPLARQQPAVADYFRTLGDMAARGEGCVEAIAFDAQKSVVPVPSCWLFDAQGNLAASVTLNDEGSDSSQSQAESLAENLPCLEERPRASVTRGVAYLPLLPRCRLLIVGGGHIGQAVGNMATDLDFDVWVLDDRAEYASETRFPRAQCRIQGEIGQTLASIEITTSTYCLIVTRGHNHDEEALYHLVGRGARYVGMIGSRRKIKLIFDDLLAQGVAPDELAKVYAPLGIDIGSQTVPEIAISILAELVAHRNLGGQVPGRPANLISTGVP